LLFFLLTAVFVVFLSVPTALLAQRAGSPPNGVSALTPLGLGLYESVLLLAALAAALLMTQIERGKFSSYGLPLRFAFGKHFWIGSLAGFTAISGSLLGIFAFHGFHLGAMAIHGRTLVVSAAAWTLAFVIVGLSEEFAFRGYLQYTLTTGIGFWPSAVVMSLLFGAVHRSNPGETWFGVLQVVLFGLLLCVFLRRTGNLWWAVGFHAGWDWGQTFFYGVRDSGMPADHSLFNSSFSGPGWLTGGTVGPEGSVITAVVLVVVAVVFSRVYREVPGSARKIDVSADAGSPATSNQATG
jgi:membrane protease YdiL (CAAX protease family)